MCVYRGRKYTYVEYEGCAGAGLSVQGEGDVEGAQGVGGGAGEVSEVLGSDIPHLQDG